MDNNNAVIERVNDIYKAVVVDKKDMYLYVLSVLTDINYDELYKEYTNRNDNNCYAAINRDRVKKAMLMGTSAELSVAINPGITLKDVISNKFTVELEDGDIDDFSIFYYLFGYLRMSKFLNDCIKEETV